MHARFGELGLIAALTAATALAGIGSLFIGYAPLSMRDVIDGLFTDQGTLGIIMRDIRLPRMLLGLMSGAALGMSGAALQGLLRNPLAEPGVMGIASCASLGAVIAIYFGLSREFGLALPAIAMLGALTAAGLLSAISSRDNGILILILAGVALANLAAALMALAMNLAPNPWAVSEIIYWLMGSLKDRSMEEFYLAAPFVAIGLAMLAMSGRALDALTLGDEAATSLGIKVVAMQRLVTLGVALAVGASVAVTGAIAFVGLIVPHLCRPFVGHMPSRLLVPSAIGGALLVVVADTTVRLVPSGPELMLGVFTSLIGVPFFLWLVFKLRRETQ
jgi:iron complex transport system permease protein